MPRQQIPTVIVGSNPLLRESLSRFLSNSTFEIVGLASQFDENVPALPEGQDVLLIIDACDRPGEATDQIEQFRREYPSGRIVVLANHCAPAEMVRVFRAGASGYFATIATRDDFVKSLELVMGGQTILPSEGISSVLVSEAASVRAIAEGPDTAPIEILEFLNSSVMPRFSERELHILRCLTQGSSNKVIARECDIAEGTVKVHVKAILRKIKVQNRTQAAIWALHHHAQVWPVPAEEPEVAAVDGIDNRVVNVRLGTQTIDAKVAPAMTGHLEATVNSEVDRIGCVAGTAASR